MTTMTHILDEQIHDTAILDAQARKHSDLCRCKTCVSLPNNATPAPTPVEETRGGALPFEVLAADALREYRTIEREAREYGEAEYYADCARRGACADCGGDGRVPAWGTGELAGGWADVCDTCGGDGKARCAFCGEPVHVRMCAELREVMQ